MIEEYGMGSQLIARGDGSSSETLSEATRGKRDGEQQALIDEAQREARCLVTDHRELLDKLAAALLANESLDRREIERIMGSETKSDPAPAAVAESTPESSNGSERRPSEPPPGIQPVAGPRFRRDGAKDPSRAPAR
jgi:cell division protease FtsH